MAEHSVEVFGVPGWVLAVMVSCFASFLTVAGFMLQKTGQADALADAEGRRRYVKLGDMVLSPRWVLGFMLSAIAPLPGDLVAFGLAPLSLTTPLSGFTVVLNLVLAPKLLGETIQRIPDFPATAVILVGTVLTTATGARKDGPKLSPSELVDLASDPIFVCALAALLVLLACAYAHMWRNRLGIEERARERPSNPVVRELVLPAFFAAGCGGLTNIGLKATAEFAGQMQMIQAVAMVVVGVLPFAALQLNFVNRGLRLYMQTVYFPVYNSLLVLTTTSYGAIFYREYKVLLETPWRIAVFALGVALIVLGICGFTLRVAESPSLSATIAGHKEACRSPAGGALEGKAPPPSLFLDISGRPQARRGLAGEAPEGKSPALAKGGDLRAVLLV